MRFLSRNAFLGEGILKCGGHFDLMFQTAKLRCQLRLSMKLADDLSFANVMDSTEHRKSDNRLDPDFEEDEKRRGIRRRKKGSSSGQLFFLLHT